MTDIFGEMKKYGMQLPPGWAENNPYLREDTPPPPPGSLPHTPPDKPNVGKRIISGTYEIISADTVPKGIALIRTTARGHEQTHGVYRPLTFHENIAIRTEVGERIIKANPGLPKADLEKLLQKEDIFNNWLDSITGVAYQAKGTEEFKIIPACKELITIPENHADTYWPARYASMKGTTLRRSEDKYNEPLSRSEAAAHKGWIAALENDTGLLTRYVNVIYSVRDKAMTFWLVTNPEADQVRALYASILSDISNACGNVNLLNYARFLRVSPNASPPQGGGAKK